MGNPKVRKRQENRKPGRHLNIYSSPLRPRESVFFRGRLAAVVSLVSELYLLLDIGILVGRCGNFGKMGNPKVRKTPEDAGNRAVAKIYSPRLDPRGSV